MKSMTRKSIRLNKKIGGTIYRRSSSNKRRGVSRRSGSNKRMGVSRRSGSNRRSSSIRSPVQQDDVFSNINRDYGQFSDRDFVPSSDPSSFSNIKGDYRIWEEDDFRPSI